MSTGERFKKRYEEGDTPWDLGQPDKNLMDMVTGWPIPRGRALEVGCGSGWDCVWLAGRGFSVTGTDLSGLAVQWALSNADAANVREKCTFLELDFIEQTVPGTPFDFLLDRGCFHIFDDTQNERERFVKNAAAHLETGGLWLSLLGSADDPPRDHGPPMRTAAETVAAVEPYFEILSLQTGRFNSERETPPKAWLCLMKKRQK
ncbi:MAG: class I SAM-dependent methyltransferase [bacterium]|nr:class I SAM-dependent methyltransferase [bacterium]